MKFPLLNQADPPHGPEKRFHARITHFGQYCLAEIVVFKKGLNAFAVVFLGINGIEYFLISIQKLVHIHLGNEIHAAVHIVPGGQLCQAVLLHEFLVENGSSRSIEQSHHGGHDPTVLDQLYHTIKHARLVAVKARDASAYESAEQAFKLLPADVSLGATWRQSEHTQVLENTGSPWETLFRIVEPVSIDYVVESNEASVRVPAGEFNNCIKVRGSGKTNVDVGNYIGRTLISIEVENWYAKGVGLIKSIRKEITTSEALDYGELRYELEDLSH